MKKNQMSVKEEKKLHGNWPNGWANIRLKPDVIAFLV